MSAHIPAPSSCSHSVYFGSEGRKCTARGEKVDQKLNTVVTKPSSDFCAFFFL